MHPCHHSLTSVKIFGGKGVITAVVAGKVTIALPKAPKAKVGDAAEFDW